MKLTEEQIVQNLRQSVGNLGIRDPSEYSTTDLVARLISYAKDQGGWHAIDETCEEAADTIQRLTKERDEARELKLDAESTLSAWFDLSKKAENAGAEILRDSVKMWLKKARSGGMPSEQADLVASVIDDAASLYLWKALVPVLRTMIDAKEARVAELEAALKPFAAMPCGICENDDPAIGVERCSDDTPVYVTRHDHSGQTVAAGHFRTARAAIARDET